MKKIEVLSLFCTMCFLILITTCEGQTKTNNAKTGEKFDVETYNKHQQNGSYVFNIKGAQVRQLSYATGYEEEITYPGKLFNRTKDFYKNGNIKQEGSAFIKGGFMKGVWKFFDSSGNLTHETNYDSWYKFSWENVRHFLRLNHVYIKDVIAINRTWQKGDRKVWVISYQTTPDKKGNFIREVTLNGETGRIEKDERLRPQRN